MEKPLETKEVIDLNKVRDRIRNIVAEATSKEELYEDQLSRALRDVQLEASLTIEKVAGADYRSPEEISDEDLMKLLKAVNALKNLIP